MISFPFSMFLLFLASVLIEVLDLWMSSPEDWPRSRSESLHKRIASILIFIALASWSGIAAFYGGDASQHHCCSCKCEKESSK